MTGESGTQIEQPYPNTEELIYEHIKEAPQRQMEVADKLDDKMLRIFGAASIVLGFLSLSSAGSLGWKAIFFVLPLLPYACTVFWTFRHVNPVSSIGGSGQTSFLPSGMNQKRRFAVP